jgi:TolB protein
MNSDGNGVRQLTFNPASETVPAWSPDGRFLSYQSDEGNFVQIYVIDIQSGQIRQVTNTASCSNWAPSWSPDGRSFAFYSNCDGSREIYTMDVNGGNRQRLTFTTNGNNKFPVWSPDGQKILYAGYVSGGYKVIEMNRDGSNQRIITAGCVCAYSPDGEWVAFSEYCDDLGAISKIRIDGSDLFLLDKQYGNKNPSWSNDGRWIVFQSDRSGNEDIWVMDADGNNWQQLTDHPGRDSAAVWQPLRR